MNSLYISFILISVAISGSFALIGVDLPQYDCENITKSHLKCLVKHGASFAVVEAFHGALMQNEMLGKVVKQARKAGMDYVDLSALFCVNCMGNENIVRVASELAASIRVQEIKFGRLWLSVYRCAGCWNFREENCAYLQKAAMVFRSAGIPIGIFTNSFDWPQVMGNCTGFSDLPLWYHHFDNVASFSDREYYAFSGWEQPAMKQYWNISPKKCDAFVMMDYMPARSVEEFESQKTIEIVDDLN